MKIIKNFFYLLALLGLASGKVVNAEPVRDANVEQLAALLASTFMTPESDLDNNIIDRRIRLKSDELQGIWFYYQLNTGENSKLYRQRIFHLIEIENGVRQKTYTPSNLERWEDAWAKPELIENLRAGDFEPSFDGSCDLIWTQRGPSKWSGYVDPKLCKHYSKRRDAHIYIESESIIDQYTLQQTERGFDLQGKQLWGTKPGDYILLNRIAKPENSVMEKK